MRSSPLCSLNSGLKRFVCPDVKQSELGARDAALVSWQRGPGVGRIERELMRKIAIVGVLPGLFSCRGSNWGSAKAATPGHGASFPQNHYS